MAALEPDDRITLAKVDTTLEGVVKTLGEVRDEVRGLRGETVSRGEWMQRNAYVDMKFDSQGSDISEIRTDLASRRAPWWSVAAVVVAAAAVLWSIFGPVIIAS
jgi:hypothetical protein